MKIPQKEDFQVSCLLDIGYLFDLFLALDPVLFFFYTGYNSKPLLFMDRITETNFLSIEIIASPSTN
jgi:hypothetical protein